MKKTVVVLAAVLSLGFGVAAARSGEGEHKPHGQKDKHAHSKHEGHEHMGSVQVGPEHKHLHQFVGTWKVEHKMWFTPDSEPALSTGTEVTTLILDGRAVASQFESTSQGGTFKGYGLTTWNVTKQKYQGCWVDIFSRNGIELSWGTYDEAGKTWTWQMKMMGCDGKMQPMRGVGKMLGKDHQSMVFYITGPDGKEFKTMEFEYTRIK